MKNVERETINRLYFDINYEIVNVKPVKISQNEYALKPEYCDAIAVLTRGKVNQSVHDIGCGWSSYRRNTLGLGQTICLSKEGFYQLAIMLNKNLASLKIEDFNKLLENKNGLRAIRNQLYGKRVNGKLYEEIEKDKPLSWRSKEMHFLDKQSEKSVVVKGKDVIKIEHYDYSPELYTDLGK